MPLCACGCGQRVKRETLRFVHGHNGLHAGKPLFLYDLDTQCIVWQRSTNSKGYGLVSVGQHGRRLAHHVEWEADNGPVPPGMQLHHRCGNKLCCNSLHLELVDPAEHARLHDNLGLRERYA